MEIYLVTRFWWDISQSVVDIKLLPVSGCHIGILHPVLFRSASSYRHVVLPAKFCSNRTISCGVMTSYRFFRIAAIESKIYFWVRLLWWHAFGKVDFHARFRYDISIHGRDKTTSSLGKWTAAILEFYIRFWFDLSVVKLSFCIYLPNIVVMGRSAAE